MHNCEHCKDTGVWLSSDLEDIQRIEKCDSCNKFGTDIQASNFVSQLLYSNKEKDNVSIKEVF